MSEHEHLYQQVGHSNLARCHSCGKVIYRQIAMKYILLTLTTCFLLTLATHAQECKSINGLPDPKCSPGVARTQDLNVICHMTTNQFRPSLYQGLKFKKDLMKKYGVTDYHSVVLDHVIALSAGGAGFDERNMYLQPKTGPYSAAEKDKAERLIHKRICSGAITAAEGQRELATDWTKIK